MEIHNLSALSGSNNQNTCGVIHAHLLFNSKSSAKEIHTRWLIISITTKIFNILFLQHIHLYQNNLQCSVWYAIKYINPLYFDYKCSNFHNTYSFLLPFWTVHFFTGMCSQTTIFKELQLYYESTCSPISDDFVHWLNYSSMSIKLFYHTVELRPIN